MRRSELPLGADGSIYHLGMKPHQASNRCILVGDPQRVALARPLLERILHEGAHREFHWITGLYRGLPITIIGTGIGADNTEIAVLELEALHNVDLSRGIPFPTRKKLYFLRIGTSGLLQSGTPIGTVVFSDWAVGVDALQFFYKDFHEVPLSSAIQNHWREKVGTSLPWYGTYASKRFQELANKVHWEGFFVRGGTYSAAGFYGPQGRSLLGKIQYPQLPKVLSAFSWEGQPIQNIEMETAALYGLARSLGHEAGALCLGIAQRAEGEFVYANGGLSPEALMKRLLALGLEWLTQLT